MNRIGFSALALAIGLVAAPQARAQSTSQLLVCRDGQVTSTRYGVRACDNHGGIDQQATVRGRSNGVNGTRGVYNGSNGTINGTNGQRGVYNGGSVNGSNREIYGGAANRGVYNGTVSGNGTTRANRDNDDDDRGNNGKHKGWYKHKKHKHGD